MDNREREESGKDWEVEVADLSRSGQIRERRAQSWGPSSRPRQWVWRLASAAGVSALVLLVLVLNVYRQLPPHQIVPRRPPPLTLRPQTYGMTCLFDAAWSPQGTRIALLGAQQVYCPDNTGTSQRAGLVTVYDASAGKVLATLHPDDATVSALQAFLRGLTPGRSSPPAEDITQASRYQHVLWSPDGKRLALTFAFDPSLIGWNGYLPDGEPLEVVGVLLADEDGTHPQVLLHLVGGAYAQSPVEWDLSAGTLILAPTPPYACNALGCYSLRPPAMSYHWQADGTLATDTPLSESAPPPVPPLAPVGQPDGGSAFTIWQPGFVAGVSHLGPSGPSHLPGIYVWSTTVEAWSPNARYLLDAIVPATLIELPGMARPTQDELSADLGSVPWFLPMRDAGLLQALRTVNPENPAGTAVSWRPDGRRLATYAPEGLLAPHPLLLYDCATGRQVTTLLPPAAVGGAALLGQSIVLRWSPDGRHLLLFALALGQVVVWGPQQLPG